MATCRDRALAVPLPEDPQARSVGGDNDGGGDQK